MKMIIQSPKYLTIQLFDYVTSRWVWVYLNQGFAVILIHAYIRFKLDYYNSLRYGIPKLQRLRNTGAHIVTLTRKYDSITPIMLKLYWLPVQSRIILKANCYWS